MKKIDEGWSFADCRPRVTCKWTHGYHRYPAKFIPQLVERLLDEYIGNGEAHINDPFCGCGTTIVTAISRGYKASGTDINRIAPLITKVKATPIEPGYLNRRSRRLLALIRGFLRDGGKPLIPRRHRKRIDRWFIEKNRDELGRMLRIIYEEDDEAIRDFFCVAFSHILKKCSVWMQGSTKPARNPNKRSPNPYESLKRHIRRMRHGNEIFYRIVRSEVRENLNDYLEVRTDDARSQPVPDNSVDLIVSSSPYVISYEYADLHQLSTMWLDLARDLKEYRKEFIGTAYKRYEDVHPRSRIAQDIVSSMFDKDERMAREIQAFFIDMDEVFDESYRILKPGGRCCYVIGNTRMKGVDILNAEVFSESLQYSGFELDRIIKRQIPAKTLPQKRDEETGKFVSNDKANVEAYPAEYIVIGLKDD